MVTNKLKLQFHAIICTMTLEPTYNEPIIRKIWRNNQTSSSMVLSIPDKLAYKHGIKEGSNIVVMDIADGILFKRLVIKEN